MIENKSQKQLFDIKRFSYNFLKKVFLFRKIPRKHWSLQLYHKENLALAQAFSREFCKIFKNTFFLKTAPGDCFWKAFLKNTWGRLFLFFICIFLMIISLWETKGPVSVIIGFWKISEHLLLREKCPNTEFFLFRIFLYLDRIRRTGKYGPDKLPYLDTFHAGRIWKKQKQKQFGDLTRKGIGSCSWWWYFWKKRWIFILEILVILVIL